MMQIKLMNAVMVSFLCAVSVAASASPTAERHAQRGLECSACHGKAALVEGAFVDSKTCIACHGDNAKVAERVAAKKKLKTDPHLNHVVNVPCTDCHKGHQPSRNMCADCHMIEFNVP